MSKYVYANIRVPIKVSDDLTVFDILSEHMTIDFEACSDLDTTAAETSSADTNLINKLMNMSDLGITQNLFEKDQPQHDVLPDKMQEMLPDKMQEMLPEKVQEIDYVLPDKMQEMDDALPENEVTIKINKNGFVPNGRKRDNLTFRVMPDKSKPTTAQTRKVYRVITN